MARAGRPLQTPSAGTFSGGRGGMLPPVPPESDWFPVRIVAAYTSDTAPAPLPSGAQVGYLIQEVYADKTGLIVDKDGGRANTTSDYGVPVDGTRLPITPQLSAPDGSKYALFAPAVARRAPGAGGTLWEVWATQGQFYRGTTTVDVAAGSLGKGSVTVPYSGRLGGTTPSSFSADVFNPWKSLMPKNTTCVIAWMANTLQFEFVALDC